MFHTEQRKAHLALTELACDGLQQQRQGRWRTLQDAAGASSGRGCTTEAACECSASLDASALHSLPAVQSRMDQDQMLDCKLDIAEASNDRYSTCCVQSSSLQQSCPLLLLCTIWPDARDPLIALPVAIASLPQRSLPQGIRAGTAAQRQQTGLPNSHAAGCVLQATLKHDSTRRFQALQHHCARLLRCLAV